MTKRKDLVTASRVDLALILQPLIGLQETARMLSAASIPISLALRVLTQPSRRRVINQGPH